MSFEGYYQKVCANGHYFECDVYQNRDNCVDCYIPVIYENIVDVTNCEDAGYVRIPVDKVGDVDKKFFEKYLSSKEKIKMFKERNEKLVHPRYFDFFKDEYPLEKIVELFQYFDKNKTLRIEFKLMRDAGSELVPYVFASFGEVNFDKNSVCYMQWQPMYIDDYGMEVDAEHGYQCCEFCYDGDIRYIVIQLYKKMWKRCFDRSFDTDKYCKQFFVGDKNVEN